MTSSNTFSESDSSLSPGNYTKVHLNLFVNLSFCSHFFKPTDRPTVKRERVMGNETFKGTAY